MDFSSLKVVFTGPLTLGGTCEMRRKTLERNGAKTRPVSYLSSFQSRIRFLRRVQRRLRLGPSIRAYNQALKTALNQDRPNLLWVEKGLFVQPGVIKRAREIGAASIHYSPDNYFIAQNTSRHFKRSLRLYDLVVTTKPGAEARLRKAGAKRTLLSGNAYDERVHRPVELSAEEMQHFGCDLTFIGRWEPNREEVLDAIIGSGISVKIWGPNWSKARLRRVKDVAGGSAESDNYARAICGASITLCLLSHLAKDTITQRSVEIPACGGFMLAERTADHLAHFEEGTEAEYFGNVDEMIQKIGYYLANPERRRAIAAAGRERCIRSGYSYTARIREILSQVPELARLSNNESR